MTKWPKCLPKIEQLVKAGFFYTCETDEVECIECSIILFDSQETDQLLVERAKLSLDCLLVKIIF